jgi:hypothetical protein
MGAGRNGECGGAVLAAELAAGPPEPAHRRSAISLKNPLMTPA